MPHNILFLMDPLESINAHHDTSFLLMSEHISQGDNVFYLSKFGISFVIDHYEFTVTQIIPDISQNPPFQILKHITLHEKDVSALWIRTDPPFDESYLTHTWQLSHLEGKFPILNSPTGIRTVNEKIWAAGNCQKWTPRTVMTRQKSVFLSALAQFKIAIIKPTSGFGGSGIFKTHPLDPNRNVIFETLSQNGQKDVIIQEFLDSADKGDKRILLLNGEILGAVLRVHNSDDFRNNFAAGGSCIKTSITPTEEAIVAELKQTLLELKLFFVGIDIIGDKLIEVNVTSPTCLVELKMLENSFVERTVIKAVHSLI